MSAFTDTITADLAVAFQVFGSVSVSISGVAGTFAAVVDQFSAERELELGGFVGTYDAVAFIQAADAAGITAPIERTLEGRTLTVDGRTFRIDRAIQDDAGITLGLANPAKRKK